MTREMLDNMLDNYKSLSALTYTYYGSISKADLYKMFTATINTLQYNKATVTSDIWDDICESIKDEFDELYHPESYDMTKDGYKIHEGDWITNDEGTYEIRKIESEFIVLREIYIEDDYTETGETKYIHPSKVREFNLYNWEG